MEHMYLIYFYLVVAAIVTHVPYFKINVYTSLVNTLVHEISHALCSILTGGGVKEITLHHDASGLAVTTATVYTWRDFPRNVWAWFSRVLVSYAGYTGASLSTVGLFYLLSKGKYEEILYVFVGISVITLVLWIRNTVGTIWTIFFIGVIGLALYYQLQPVILHLSVFLSTVMFIQSITTAFTICKLSIKQRKQAGDATNLAQFTFIPAFLWGTLFFVQSLYAGYYIMRQFLL